MTQKLPTVLGVIPQSWVFFQNLFCPNSSFGFEAVAKHRQQLAHQCFPGYPRKHKFMPKSEPPFCLSLSQFLSLSRVGRKRSEGNEVTEISQIGKSSPQEKKNPLNFTLPVAGSANSDPSWRPTQVTGPQQHPVVPQTTCTSSFPSL